MILYLIITYLIGFGQFVYCMNQEDRNIPHMIINIIISPIWVPMVIGATLEKFHDEN